MAQSLRREFLQLADHYKPEKSTVTGWFLSEKLDGTRCFWDGGVTRGIPTEQVPWASVVDPKTGKKKAKIKPIATGLWSRYGNPIIAPDWWLNQLPACPLDGELWAGRGKFQLCRSICGGDTPDPRFDEIVFAVYSSPPLAHVFATGEIKNTNMVRPMDFITCEHWIRQQLDCKPARDANIPVPQSCYGDDYRYMPPGAPFLDELRFLNDHLDNGSGSICFLHPQTQLSHDPEQAAQQLDDYLKAVLDRGGEGVVIRDPMARWTPKRHKGVLKFKPFQDGEAVVVGFTAGRQTDKGSRLLGKIGALVVDFNGKRLELAGLTDAEREFATDEMAKIAAANPGEDVSGVQGKHFQVGQMVSFKFRELTDDGIPKEARYWRGRDPE